MTERESYTIKSIELHLFLGRIILKQISALSPAEDYNALSSFEKKYKTYLKLRRPETACFPLKFLWIVLRK